jgi:hypothetical protein
MGHVDVFMRVGCGGCGGSRRVHPALDGRKHRAERFEQGGYFPQVHPGRRLGGLFIRKVG